MSPSLRTQLGQLTRRSIMRTLRQPAQIVPALAFPLFLLALNTGGLDGPQTARFPTTRTLPRAGFTFSGSDIRRDDAD